MTNNHTWHSTTALGLALVATVFAGGSALAASSMYPDTPNASVIAFNQKAKGNSVSINYAFLPQNGTLAIYPINRSGKVGATPLGKISLQAGDHRNVDVALNSSPKKGTRLQAVIEKSGQPLKNSGDVPERTFVVL